MVIIKRICFIIYLFKNLIKGERAYFITLCIQLILKN
jgi:hypothetical protein